MIGDAEPLSDWVAGMDHEDMEGQVKKGGMIQINPMNPPLSQTLRELLWESYPDRLAEKLRKALKAHEELVDAAVSLMEGYLQSLLDSTQTSEESSSSGVTEMYLEGLDRGWMRLNHSWR